MLSFVLRIHLLGRPRLEWGGEPIPFSARPKVLPLLGFLLLHSAAPTHLHTARSLL
jgi:DNA-binding SARP family transcriptional activator